MIYLLNLIYLTLPYTIKYLPILNNNNLKFYSYIFSTLHATLMSINVLLYFSFNIICRSLYTYSLMYFISDLYIIKYLNIQDKYKFYIHHLIPIIVLILYLNNYFNFIQNRDEIVMRMYITEIPIITLNICWFLIQTNKDNTFIFKILQILTYILYFFCRVVNLTNIIFQFINDNNNLLYPVFILTIINYYWFIKLSKKIIFD